MKENTTNMVAENRECVTYRHKNNTSYPGEIEGYDYVKCPVDGCGKIYRVSLSKHMWDEHHMTVEETKEKYGINMKPKKCSSKIKKFIPLRRANTIIHPGEIEGYNYVKCPICGLPDRYSIREHMKLKHNMTDNEIDKKLKEYNIIYMTPQKSNCNSNIEIYMKRLKVRGLTIVDGKIKEISKEKEENNIKDKGEDSNTNDLIDKHIENFNNLINKSELKKLISNIIKDIFIGLSSSLEK